MNKVVILGENNCHFVNLLSFTEQLFSSQSEINHMIQDPTKVNLNICRPPLMAIALNDTRELDMYKVRRPAH